MASKLFAPFKKFPQQLPIFKKLTDKFKDVTMSNYNAVYGMLEDVTCHSFDNNLYLLALGTKKGEIKIYGSPGIVYTLVNSPLKPICFLKFLDGQGRIISINSDNEMSLWEYRVESANWEATSTLSNFLPSQIPNVKVTSLDVSQPFSWKSDYDELLQVLLIGTNMNTVQQILIIGNYFHLYEEDLSIDSNYLLTKCQNLEKDYDFGGVDQICFHPTDNEKFFISYKNGLLLVMERKITNEDSKSETNVETREVVNEIAEVTGNDEKVHSDNETVEDVNKQQETNDNTSSVSKEIAHDEKEVGDERNEVIEKPNDDTTKSETEKDKVIDEVPKSEESKPEVKKLKKSFQVPNTYVQIPSIINYILNDKKVNSACWYDYKINTINDDSGCINLYEINNDNLKISEPDKAIILPENFQTHVSKLSYFSLKTDNMGVFVSNMNEKQHLLVVMKDDKVYAEIETPSCIIDYIIVKGHVSDEDGLSQPTVLLILCESQLIGINLECENLTEIQCPYLVLQNTSIITSLTSVIQVPALIFANSQSINETFKDWPFKTATQINEKIDEETSIDIIGTGHADGSVNIWQVMSSGVLCLLVKIDSSDIFNHTSNMVKENIDLIPLRKQVGHRLIDSDDNLLQITNLQLMLHGTNNFSESSSNELYCVASNFSGTVLIFKYDGSDDKESITEISSDFDSEGLTWIDSPAPELLDKSDISDKLPKLNYIVRLNPPLPVTALAFQPTWDLLGVGCTYGLVLVDFRQNKCVFSHLTIHRTSKSNNVTQPPLTVGQQLKKSIRQSFRKLKKLKPAAKHTYTVNEEKSKDKEEIKPIEKEEGKESTKPEEEEEANQQISESTEVNEEKVKEETKENAEENDNAIIANENIIESAETELVTMEISRKDKPATTVGSLLIVYTSLTSSNKIPCLFAGTNIGAIFAFEISFEDDIDGSIAVKLSKELHLQHKAPILLMSITNASHIPLLGLVDQIGSYERKFKISDELKNEDEKPDEVNEESKAPEVEIGPSGDSDSKEDAKLKCGTLPSPAVQEETAEPTETGARRSVDSSKDKINISNVNMKKSGTLPASFLQAIGKSQGSSDSHELLVVSEEQVKLFNLPSLKAKYKYKVVDTGHHFSHSKAASSQETEQEKKNDNVTTEIQNEVLTAKTVIRRISSVGLCKMRSLKYTGEKWSVAIALTNGEIVALQLSNLKKYLSNVFNYSPGHILAGISNGELNLIASYAQKFNIKVTDFSQSRFHRYEPNIFISIPKNARPIREEKVEVEATVNQAAEVQSEPAGTETIVNGHHNEHEDEEKDQMGDEAVVQNASAVHHGDITMDSIKEYITNVDGNVTIKTFESTKEKQITVDGGQIVTTIHEKQIRDGEIIKDDVVKITSDTRASEELSVKE